MAKSADQLAMKRDPEASRAAASPAAPLAGGPVLDLVHLSRQTLGDADLERELLTLFEGQSRQFANRLGAPARPGEGKWRGDLAHTLAGSARAIGAFEVARAAQCYEDAARAEAPEAETHWARLDAAIAAARASIAELLEQG